MIVVLIIAVWWLIGVGGFIFWWTSQHDLHTDDLAFGCVAGLFLGPLAWLVGAFVHGNRKPASTLLRRRS